MGLLQLADLLRAPASSAPLLSADGVPDCAARSLDQQDGGQLGREGCFESEDLEPKLRLALCLSFQSPPSHTSHPLPL